MMGVHRSANTSAPSAMGQYCPYPSTPPTILRRCDPSGSPDFELLPVRPAASMLAPMTTTAHELLGTGRLRPHRGAGRGPRDGGGGRRGRRPGHAGARRRRRHRERRAARRRRRRRRGGHRHHAGAAGGGGAARPRARPDAALAGGRRAGAAVRRRRVRRRAVVHRRDVRPGPRHDGPRAAAGVPPRRNGGDGQLDAGRRRRALLPPPRPLRPAAGRRPVADGVGRPRSTSRALFARAEVQTEPRRVRLRFTGPPAEVTAYYRRHFPPVIATFAGLDPDRAAALERELVDLYAAEDTGPAGGPSCYELEYLLVRRAGWRSSSGRHLHVHQRQRREPARRRAPGRRGAPSAARPASGRRRAR